MHDGILKIGSLPTDAPVCDGLEEFEVEALTGSSSGTCKGKGLRTGLQMQNLEPVYSGHLQRLHVQHI